MRRPFPVWNPATSHSPAVSARAASVRGARIVASLARSLRFPTRRLPASATGGGRLRSHRRRVDGNLSKYNVRTHQKSNREQNTLVFQKEINPTFVGLISFWNPATSYSPGRFRSRCFAHWACASENLAKYNVRTYMKTGRVR